MLLKIVFKYVVKRIRPSCSTLYRNAESITVPLNRPVRAMIIINVSFNKHGSLSGSGAVTVWELYKTYSSFFLFCQSEF